MTRPIRRWSSLYPLILLPSLLTTLLFSSPALAYHPLSTDDPGTTEFRHFELEWGNDLIWPEGRAEEASGYLAIKAGLAPGLEFDFAQSFFYWLEPRGEDAVSGWGDAQVVLKYRFLGDGDGPFNLGIESVCVLPSGESEKGLSEGDTIIPTAFFFGSVGSGEVRVFLNAGVTFYPEAYDAMLYGAAVEWTVTEKTTLVAEVFGESDLQPDQVVNDPLEALVGVLYSPTEELTLSGGVSFGLNEATDDYRLTLGMLVGW